MFSQSGTNTPVPSSRNVPIPIHDTIGESITWINDWFSPDFNHADKGEEIQNANSLQLKGWVKTNQNHKSNTLRNGLNSYIELNQSKWSYLKKETKQEETQGFAKQEQLQETPQQEEAPQNDATHSDAPKNEQSQVDAKVEQSQLDDKQLTL
ncbi:hypothetical protein CANMA_000986 [Candida margitis]|uniref:uncharacterized protein n=1 Tax=Candida margitis TaxID=1775924 RepID=UPI0022273652|nr:uncharacterized protein CANMA_000986 [Candida margitis]KAI5969946.1 hypothetical protein CANMA_000986 [Candida margitis]